MKKFICVFALFIMSNYLVGQAKVLDDSLHEMMNDLGVPGMSVAMSKDGELIYSKSFGFSDQENKTKVISETKFRMASVSKLFAVGAIAKLLEEGKIGLGDPIEKYVTDFPHKNKGVTIKRILNHTSGVRHYNKSDRFIDFKNYKTTDKALKIFMNDDLESEPGSRYAYSTHAFTLLAAVVESVSGKSYPDYLKEEFFIPLKMTNSSPDVKVAKGANQSLLYDGMKRAKFYDNPSYKRAGGGMLSTAEDLVKFGESHLKSGFFQQSTLDSLFKPSIEMPGTLVPTNVALAWRVSKDCRGETIYHHAGNMNGARSFLMLSPTDGVVVSIMTNNRELYLIEHVATAIRDLFVLGEGSFPEKINFGKECMIDIKPSGLNYAVTLDIPEFFSEPQKIKLIASNSENGLILQNYETNKSVLYVALDKERLVIVLKDLEGNWIRKEYL